MAAVLLLLAIIFLGVPMLLAGTLMIFGTIGMLIGVHTPRPHHLPSDIYFTKRNYKNWSARQGWLRASHLFYECGICHTSLPSETSYPRECGCGNLFIGPDHICAQTPAKVRLFKE